MGIFAFRGKEGRPEFFLIQVTLLCIWYGLLRAVASTDPITGETTIPVPFFIVIYLTYAYMATCSAIRRLHDTGNTGFFVLLLLVPIAGLALIIYLLFAPSTGVATRHDAKPGEIGNLSTDTQHYRARLMGQTGSAAIQPPSEDQFLNDDGTFNTDGIYN